MSVSIQFAGDSAPVEEVDAVDFEISDISQHGGLLIVKLLNADGGIHSTHANVRSVWK